MGEAGAIATVEQFVSASVDAHAELTAKLEAIYPQIAAGAQLLLDTYKDGGKAIFFGNGGSAADAQHFACELVGQFAGSRAPLPALALSVDTSAVTAISNDFGYEAVFSRQLRAHARPGDVAIAISTSGSSRNIVAAAKLKHALDIKLIALVGERTDCVAPFADVVIAVPSLVTPRIQETHALIGHILCEWVEREMFPETQAS